MRTRTQKLFCSEMWTDVAGKETSSPLVVEAVFASEAFVLITESASDEDGFAGRHSVSQGGASSSGVPDRRSENLGDRGAWTPGAGTEAGIAKDEGGDSVGPVPSDDRGDDGEVGLAGQSVWLDSFCANGGGGIVGGGPGLASVGAGPGMAGKTETSGISSSIEGSNSTQRRTILSSKPTRSDCVPLASRFEGFRRK